ncbi:replication-relaxation family protein [Baekduia soli]|uniref:replication-relaxation family protein n=1 Tax=Baekduia soli TaxID=496014 RepID=UPI001651F0CD|nr:replication-relaxation family protein [Baekduia soli]
MTVDLLALRFGVSVQQARARVRRLEGEGLVVAVRAHVSEPKAIYLSPKGARAIGRRPRRKAPRAAVQREHELAVVELAAGLELAAHPGVEVLSERDCQGREADGLGRFSIDVLDDRGQSGRRWPDLIVCQGDRRVAIEIEFATKAASRLASIVASYLASELAEVRFLVASPALAARLARITTIERGRLANRRISTNVALSIAPWQHAPESVYAAIVRSAGAYG